MPKCCCRRRCRCYGDRGLVTLDTGQPIVIAPPAEPDATTDRKGNDHA